MSRQSRGNTQYTDTSLKGDQNAQCVVCGKGAASKYTADSVTYDITTNKKCCTSNKQLFTNTINDNDNEYSCICLSNSEYKEIINNFWVNTVLIFIFLLITYLILINYKHSLHKNNK